MRRRALPALALAALTLTACDDREEAERLAMANTASVRTSRDAMPPPPPPAAMAAAAASAAPSSLPGAPPAQNRGDWLAYRHNLQIEAHDVAAAFERTQAACQALAECRVLSSTIDGAPARSGRQTARLTIRLPRADLAGLRATATGEDRVVSSSTSADDRAAEVADIQARTAMLTSHRDRLLEIQSKARDVPSLMQLAQELSRVQTELERIGGRFRVVQLETSTDLLNISFQPISPETTPQETHWYDPVTRSLEKVPGRLADSTSAFILLAAAALPWLPVLAGVVWVGRRQWRRRQARKAPGTPA